MKGIEKFYRILAKINNFLGMVIGWGIFPMMILVAFEVTMRYIFHAPTIWTWDFNTQLLAVMGAVAAGYGLLTNSHVRVDIISTRLPKRGQAILGFITDVLTVIAIGWIAAYLCGEAFKSTLMLEHSSSVWAPPIYPERILIALGFVFLTLQAIFAMIENCLLIFGIKVNKDQNLATGAME